MKIGLTTGVLAGVALAATVLLSACGASSGTASDTTAATQGSTPVGSAPAGQNGGGRGFNDPKVQQCLASKGVTLPQFGRRGAGTTGGEGGSPSSTPSAPRPTIDAKTRQALQECGATFGGGGRGGGFNNPALRQCLASKGITLPQGGQGQGQPPTTASGGFGGLDQAARQAIQACRQQVGAGAGNGSGTSTTTPTTVG